VVLQGDGKIFFHNIAAPVFYPREVAILYQVLGSSCCNLFYILDFFSEINVESSIAQGKIRYLLWDEALTKFYCFHVV
jgi:hypothetical protein